MGSWEGLEGADGSGPGGNTKTGKYQFGPGTALGPLNITKKGSTCTLENAYVKTLNLNHGTGGVYDAFAYDCGTNNENTYKQINGAYSPMNDAHYFGNVLYNMYRDWVNLEPLKFRLSIRVHYSSNYENAFWNGRELTFGDGAYTFHPLVDINVVTHEAAHGFTGQNSGLVYRYQSGGMNEAYSDIVGESAEAFQRGNVDWMVGFETFKQAGRAMRYFKRPEDDGRSIGHASKYYNGIDVHWSSGVFNRAYYLIVSSGKINFKQAFQLFTTANRVYWTASSTYNQGACGVERAAKDLGLDVATVTKSFATVGVVGGCGGGGGGGGGGGSSCKDDDHRCPGWKAYCNAPANKSWLHKHCKKTCGVCGTSPGGGGSCKDEHAEGSRRCSTWTKYCSDSRYKDFMMKNCKKTCGWC